MRRIRYFLMLWIVAVSILLGGGCDSEPEGRPYILDVHEHIQSMDEVQTLLPVMDRLDIKKTVLVGSSWFTITLNQRVGFTRYDENNESLMRIAEKYPGRFEAWPTINPEDPDKLEKFKKLVERGATGLKLYLGHGFIKNSTNEYFFHTMALDDPEMLPIYEYCQENYLPICYHVNPGPVTPGIAQEFIAVLTQFPDLKVNCPHFMLSSIRDSRLREFLDTFPNLYTDISFGYKTYAIAGLRRISKNPGKFRNLFAQYPTRFMFGTDNVITAAGHKTEEWLYEHMKCYIDMLTKERYTTPLVPVEELNGLALSGELLERICHKNFEEFMAKKPEGTKIRGPINWSRMGVRKVDREPGVALPPPE